MKRAVVFVEGQTEQVFVCRLVRELKPGVAVVVQRERAGLISKVWGQVGAAAFEVVVIDCGSDGRVLASMKEHQGRQAAQGFVLQVGLRDVAPAAREIIARSRAELGRSADPRMRSALCFAVMEVEAWFLGSIGHVASSGWEPPMSVERSREILDSHLRAGSLEDLASPSKVIDDIYTRQGHRYRKSGDVTKRIVNALDLDELYMTAADRLPHLQELFVELEQFLTSAEPNQA